MKYRVTLVRPGLEREVQFFSSDARRTHETAMELARKNLGYPVKIFRLEEIEIAEIIIPISPGPSTPLQHLPLDLTSDPNKQT